MNATAVVVTYNNAATIGACLDSVAAAGIERCVVIDNASVDATAEIVRKHPVTLIQQTKNTGFGAAANRGAQEAHTPYILFLNPDAVLEQSIQSAIDYLNAHPRVGIVGLNVIDRDGNTERDSFGSEPTLSKLLTRHVGVTPLRPELRGAQRERVAGLPSEARQGRAELGPVTGILQVGWVSGAAMIIRRDFFQQLKGFDESFFLYWEDIDLCHRARIAGYSTVWFPMVRVRHQRGASLGDRKQKAAFYDQSADRYFQKHYAAPIWLLHRYLRFLYRFFFPLAR